MSFILANSQRVLKATLTATVLGAWHTTLETDGASALSGAVSISWGLSTLKGTVVRAGSEDGGSRSSALVVGGAGGLSLTLPGKYYSSSPAAQSVVADILRESGESLSTTSDAAILARVLSRWTRTEGTAGSALTAVTDALGATWRVLFDGTVWIGVDTFPTSTAATATILDGADNPASGALVVDLESLSVLPGETYLGRKIREVTYTSTPEASRAELRTSTIGDFFTRALSGFQRKIDYAGTYPARVVKYDDGQIECIPDDEKVRGVGGLSHVPVRLGLPGLEIESLDPDDTRAVVSFEGNDPSRPAVLGWSQGGSLKIGSIVLVQATQPPFAVALSFFPAGLAGDAQAAAAFALGNTGSSHAQLIPLELSKLAVN